MSAARTFCLLTIPALAMAGCGGGGGGGAPLNQNVAPEMIVCRSRVDSPHSNAEASLRTLRNLGTDRIGDRTGPELRARLHPDAVQVVFARERGNGQPDSRELYVSSVDGSRAELRLTNNGARDEDPVWSPDGERVVFTSDRDGVDELWTCRADGSEQQRFAMPPLGSADSDPDWHHASNRIVFSRREPTGQHRLWLVNGDGSGALQLTDGGTFAGPDTGDVEPAFAPDGNQIVFVRRLAAERAQLCMLDLGTLDVSVRLAPDGDVALPRFAPTMDRIWLGLAEPDAGRQTLRLAHVDLATGEPTLAWPDERWQLRGIEFLPGAPAAAEAGDVERLDVTTAEVSVVFGSNSFGSIEQLTDDDDFEFYIRTRDTGQQHVAGLQVEIALPPDEPEEIVELRVRAIARVSRIDGDSVLRIAVRNPVEERNDTAVEWTPTSTGEQELSFRTSSLRHVTRNGMLRLTVIAELPLGEPADFWIDLVEVEWVPRSE